MEPFHTVRPWRPRMKGGWWAPELRVAVRAGAQAGPLRCRGSTSGRGRRAALLVLLLVAPARRAEIPNARIFLKGQDYWQSLVENGVLNGEYLDWLNCKGTEWDDFRSLYVAHIEGGKWNWANEVAWVTEREHWHLSKAAEALLETWRSKDLNVKKDDGNLSEKEAEGGYRRQPSATAVSVVGLPVFAALVASHLERVARPSEWKQDSFGSTCLPGLVAAITVFARSLTVLGKGIEEEETNDGFLLWRVEMGYVLSGLMFGEGALIFDLAGAPGWPSVSARLVEGMLRFQYTALTRTSAPVIGEPRPLFSPQPNRYPSEERLQRATDPSGSTPWGQRAMIWMAYREKVIKAALATRAPIPWARIGPPWAPALHDRVREAHERAGESIVQPEFQTQRRKVRLLGWISQHGALDLEMPSLLEALFPDTLELQYFLHGERLGVLCEKTEGSPVMDRLCRDVVGVAAGSGAAAKGGGADSPPEDGLLQGETNLPQSAKALELFLDGDGHARPPDIVTVCGWTEAIWALRNLPSAFVVLFFGPPVLLHVGVDIKKGRTEEVARYWREIDGLVSCAREGRCLIAAESLFRSEQFLYQTGSEVPFLRPMSVWVNATYSPQSIGGGPLEVLVHTRGRLKYETHFVEMCQRLAGPAFPYKVVSQRGRILPFRDLAAFYAVVILPWSPELCMLRHLFKMAVPLFVPHRSLLRNMVHISNKRLMPYPYNKASPYSNRKAVEEVHPFDPFLDTIRWPADVKGMEARMYWAEYSEYLLLPLLQAFLSSADLIARLHVSEGSKISAQMRAAYRADMQEMRGFWGEALARLQDVASP